MKGLVIAVCCLVALAVAEEEKLAEMSVQAPVSPGAVGANPPYGGSFGGQPFFGGASVSYFFNSFAFNQIWGYNLKGSYLFQT